VVGATSSEGFLVAKTACVAMLIKRSKQIFENLIAYVYTIVCFSVTHFVFELYCLSCTIAKLFLHCDSDTTAFNVRIVHAVEIQTHVASEL